MRTVARLDILQAVCCHLFCPIGSRAHCPFPVLVHGAIAATGLVALGREAEVGRGVLAGAAAVLPAAVEVAEGAGGAVGVKGGAG